MDERGEILAEPGPDVLARTAMGRFATAVDHTDYVSLHRWSVENLDAFWRELAAFTGVRWRRPPDGGVALASRAMPGARWFPGAELNHAEHALAAAADRPDDVAVVAVSQTRSRATLTWGELADAVDRCAAGFRRLGVRRGDRVVAYLPNIPETVVAFLAAASLGAVWSSCAPEFGTRAVIDRFGQLEPTVLLAVDGYRYGEKLVDRRAEVDELVAALPSLRHVVGVRYLGVGPDDWSALVATAGEGPLAFEAVPFDHPLYVLFSSGTTGIPKAIVHGHGGITLEHLKALVLHHDLGPRDRFFWFTTTGWMMWNYQVSGLLAGASVVLFDGDPGHPDLTATWGIAEAEGVTALGLSAPMIMACRRAGVLPGRGQLRWVGSTGAPLPPAGYRWVHDRLGVPVHSISGGTDVCTAFLGSAPLVPTRAGEISASLLGCKVEAFDGSGRACPPGRTGELVVTEPMPSMPVGFWGDVGGAAYRAAYFATFPGVWRHGDWVTFANDGAAVVSGRSDATLNRGGVRLGTTDFYAVVEEFPEVTDSLVVHLEDLEAEGIGTLVLFVVLAGGGELDDDLRGRLIKALRTELSPRHVPDRIDVVPAVPRTLSGKKLEVPVKRILQGEPAASVASLDSLVDPAALRWFEQLRVE